MENSVLGNALEGVPEGEEEDKPKDSNVESTESVDGEEEMLALLSAEYHQQREHFRRKIVP